MKKRTKIILGVLGALLTLVIGFGAAASLYVDSLLDEVIVEEDEVEDVEPLDLMINEELEEELDTINMALFGVDCRSEGFDGCRSDVMMMVSYNPNENNVNVTSVVRDTYTDIEGYGLDKINHAYAFGGPKLAIQTMNKTFDLNIEHYVTVDFWAVEKIIDAVGGVKIHISNEELPILNNYIHDQNNNSPNGEQEKLLSKSGEQVLNGRQAVAFMRIRYVGDGDFERMQRQREVMEVALNNLTKLTLTDMLGLVEDLISTVQTNMPKGDIIGLLTDVVTRGIPTMTQAQVPTRDGGQGTMLNGIYYFIPNTLIDNNRILHELIYPDNEYKPSDNVRELNDRVAGYLY